MAPTWLIHLSGGLDSTYALWDWLKKNPKEKIVIHHVRLSHVSENRLNFEADAVIHIMNYIRSIGYTNFIYHESTFNYGTLPRISVKDIQIVSLFTAIILKTPQYNSIRNLILPWHQGEVNTSEIKRGYRVRKMIEALEVPKEITFHFPLEHLTREEMAAALPTELLNSVHSCRKPTPQKPVCGTCKTCLEYIESGLNPR